MRPTRPVATFQAVSRYMDLLCNRSSQPRRACAQRLEPRVLLAQVGWDGEANDGLWNTARNWSNDQVPGNDDDVRIDLPGIYTVTLTGATASISSLSLGSAVAGTQRLALRSRLSLSIASVVNKTGILELDAGGQLNGSVQVNEGRFEWRGGTLAEGTITINGGTLAIGGPETKTLRGYRIDNEANGTVEWTGGGDIVFVNGKISNRLGVMNVSGNGAIRSGGGDNWIYTSAPLNQSGETLIEVPFDSTGTITEAITTVSGTLTLAGGGQSRGVFDVQGTLVFTGETYSVLGVGHITGSGTARFEGGTHHLLTTSFTDPARLEVRNSSTDVEIYEFFVTDLVVSDGATLRATRGIARTNTLSVDPLSRLDVSSSALVVDYAGTSTPLAQVREWLTSGYASGAWDGRGIGRTLEGTPRSPHGSAEYGDVLGYAESARLFTDFPATFLRFRLDDTAVIIRATHYGDANLDQLINSSDFDRMTRNYGSGATGRDWSDGDFNFDGAVTVTDFNLAAAQFPPAPPPVVDHGVVLIEGTDVPDTVGLTRRGDLLRVRVNGKLSTFPAARFGLVKILSGAESDVVDWSGTDVVAWIDTGAGNDTVTGGAADDRVYGSDGDDVIFAGAGDDLVEAGDGADTVWGERGRDSLRGGPDDDAINAGAGNDHLWGDDGDDRLYGRGGNDAMNGGYGFDRLFGDAGNDRLFAQDYYIDRLDGGEGIDRADADQSLDELLSIEPGTP